MTLGMGTWSVWQQALHATGQILTFAGLLLQRWCVNRGLAVTALGLALMGASLVDMFLLPGLVVCYEAWYISAYAGNRAARWFTLLGVGATLALGSTFVKKYWENPDLSRSAAFSMIGTWMLIATLVIALFASFGRRTADHVKRIEMLTARAELATLAERNHIAREMHDIIAHSLTAVIAQADGARYAARKDPLVAVHTLDTIANQSREALAQMRSLLSVLRDDRPEERNLEVAPGISALHGLIDEASRAGIRIDYAVSGKPVTLDDSTSLSVYRVVQEALTNVLKHAGPVETRVRLEWQSTQLRITVDNYPGHNNVEGSGRGLIGITERVRMHQGHAHWGESSIFPGGWNITATIPFSSAANKVERQ